MKFSIAGKVIITASCAAVIWIVFSEWLTVPAIDLLSKLVDVPLESKYSLFQVSDFLKTINATLNDSEIEKYLNLFRVGEVAVVALGALTAMLALFDKINLARKTAAALFIACIILSGGFIARINKINDMIEMILRENVIDKLLSLVSLGDAVKNVIVVTMMPKILFAAALVPLIGTLLTKTEDSSQTNDAPYINSMKNANYPGAAVPLRCHGCGVPLATGVKFCPGCGRRVDYY